MMKNFNSAGVRTAYVDETPADPRATVLLVHGFASNVATNWGATGWIRELNHAGYRVVAFDNRGHGESEKLYELADYGAPAMSEDAYRLLQHLGIPSAHVMGYSMGARITAFLALRHPGIVTSAIFGGLGINMVRGMAGTGPIAHALEAPTIDDVKNPTARTFRAFAEQTKSDLRALAACIRSAREPITVEALGGLRCPVLVAVGADDVVGGSAVDLAAVIPEAEAFVIPGRDHMKAVGDRAYKNAVIDFLGRHR